MGGGAEGFFTNENDFFGPGRKEYLHVTQETGCWQGMKVVGDENVPRGKVSFRTCEGEPVELSAPIKAQLQIRMDTSDPNGFSWMDGFFVAYDAESDAWKLFHGDQHIGTLARSTEEEAMQAAETSIDYSKSDWAERLAASRTDFVQMFGDTLVSKDGEVKTADVVSGKSCVMIYFSAHWCPPCRGFTPGLAEAYKGSEKAGQDTVIIFASSDRDQGGFDEYYAEMPWHAIPFSKRDAKQKLSEQFGISGIPTLVVLDGAGQLITKEGRAEYAKYL